MALVNGEPRSSIPLDDRGFAYGDGVFETIPIVDGCPALWSLHMRRLEHGCTALGFEAPPAALLRAEVSELLAGSGDTLLKIVVTRGSGGRGYRPPAGGAVRRVLTRHSLPEFAPELWRNGVTVRLCDTRLPRRPSLAGIKHLNRLEQVLARAEWNDPTVAEGLMKTTDGAVGEGTSTNVFAVIAGRLVTPPVASGGVAGIMRQYVAAQAEKRLGVEPREAALTLEEMANADEVFLTNSVIGAWPVRALAGVRVWPTWPVADRLVAHLIANALIPDWLSEERICGAR